VFELGAIETQGIFRLSPRLIPLSAYFSFSSIVASGMASHSSIPRWISSLQQPRARSQGATSWSGSSSGL